MVLAAALLVAGLIYQRTKQFTILVGLFVITALIFNPFIPIHLTRGAFVSADSTKMRVHFIEVGHFAGWLLSLVTPAAWRYSPRSALAHQEQGDVRNQYPSQERCQAHG